MTERQKIIEECAACIPTNWCDPLLTGPKAVARFTDCPAVEALLLAIKARILARVGDGEHGS